MSTLVQSVSSNDSGTGDVTLTFASPTTPGNLVVVCLGDYNFSGPYGITDDQSNFYNTAIDDTSQDYEMAVFFLLVENGVNTIRLTTSGAGALVPPIACIASEWSGIADGSLDQISDVNSNSSSVIDFDWESDSITTGQTDLLIGVAYQVETLATPVATWTVTSSGLWTDVIANGYSVNGGGIGSHWGFNLFVQYIASSAIGTYNAAGSANNDSNLDALIISFVIGSAPPIGVPQMFDYQVQIT
jgi:hypothetical protein